MSRPCHLARYFPITSAIALKACELLFGLLFDIELLV